MHHSVGTPAALRHRTLPALAPAYRPRRPTETVLYAVVRENLETFLAHARESYEAPLPHYVEQELRGYLRCGVFAHGFVRAHCDACGHDLLVAFSCKGRGACPSCAGRRMANVAAHLVDRVLPAVPVRQWVLSLPFELRALAAFRADVLSALGRHFVEAVFARGRAWARRQKLAGTAGGAVTHVQRFGSSMNLNVHFHVMVLDGVYIRDQQGRPWFHPLPPPTRDELQQVVRLAHLRTVAWLARKGYLGARPLESRSQEATAQTSIEACAAIAMQRGAVRALRDDPDAELEGAGGGAPPPGDHTAVEYEGFNLHASVAIAGGDDLGRERLMRYGARPPLALDRLRRLPGGRIGYRIKKLRDGRAKLRVMTELEFLARLAAIIPPPRYPLLRYHGVLAPRSPWRRNIIPRPRHTPSAVPTAPVASPCPRAEKPKTHRPSTARSNTSQTRRRERSAASAPTHITIPSVPAAAATAPLALTTGAALLAPNVLGVKHWSRLLDGLLYAASPRVDWGNLLRRSFDVDVLACPKCHGRLRVLSDVTDPSMVRLMLESVGLPADAPHAARARDPTDLFAASGVD